MLYSESLLIIYFIYSFHIIFFYGLLQNIEYSFLCYTVGTYFLLSSLYLLATHFSILAWKIPWTEEPGRLQSMGSLRVRHD